MDIRTELMYKAEDRPDVCEVYSPPRIVEEATKLGLRPGFSLDLTVNRDDGTPWDFNIRRHRDEVVKRVIAEEPFCLIGSPPCTMFSCLQNGNKWRFSDKEWSQ